MGEIVRRAIDDWDQVLRDHLGKVGAALVLTLAGGRRGPEAGLRPLIGFTIPDTVMLCKRASPKPE